MKSTVETMLDEMLLHLRDTDAPSKQFVLWKEVRARVVRLEIALRFYADKQRYLLLLENRGAFITDLGKTARHTLHKIGITESEWDDCDNVTEE